MSEEDLCPGCGKRPIVFTQKEWSYCASCTDDPKGREEGESLTRREKRRAERYRRAYPWLRGDRG